MRKWILPAFAILAIFGIFGYWYFAKPTPQPPVTHNPGKPGVLASVAKNDGDAEASEVIEPLVVDRGVSAPAPARIVANVELMPRVEWKPDMRQPPRPDAEFSRTLRMPYADEDEILGARLDPIVRLLESGLPRLDIFAELPNLDGAEESEPRETDVPAWNPYQPPHCPYTGSCPAPHRYRLAPRD